MQRSMIVLALVALCGARSGSAQGMGPLNAAKAAANRAVNATNAHTHEETGQAIGKRPGTAATTVRSVPTMTCAFIPSSSTRRAMRSMVSWDAFGLSTTIMEATFAWEE